jgi:hypothetical protein
VSARARALRRRTKPSLTARLRALWIVAALAALALFAIGVAVANAPQLRVRGVEASVPAGGPVSRNDVLAAAHVDPDANLWLLDTGAIRSRIEAIPYVATASVHRTQFPQPAVTLEVTLREPTECVLVGGRALTVDAAARVLQTGCATPALPRVAVSGVPAVAPGATLSGAEVDRLLADTRTIDAHVPIRLVRRDGFGGLEAVDSRGVLLRFGADGDLAEKVALVEPIRAGAAHGRPLRVIDLRAPATPVVEFP